MSDSLETSAPSRELPPEGFRYSLRTLFIGVFCCALACGFWFWIIEPSRDAALRSQCTNNLKQIGLGLRNYADVFKCFPAANAVDENQAPRFSWRLSILGFLMQLRPGYLQEFRYHERWDSPANLAFSDRGAPGVYRCPSAPKSQPLTHANYVMPVGPGAISDGKSYTRFSQVRDGAANTIAAAEIANSDIYWTEPRDLPLERMSFRVNDRSQPSVSSAHRGAAVAVFADGHTQTLSNSIDPRVLRALLTIDGGESINGAF
ncbi:MAG TPA: DUF1559 domain-containing protein [Pirellulales bacterium]|nr:DUF1559 domain-containing protein [Pirellulales bacterium]